MTPFRDLETVEFHDALVERIDVHLLRSSVAIVFAHLSVYERETPKSCGVWSFEAELRVCAVTRFSMSGELPRDVADAVEHIEIVDNVGHSLDPLSLLDGEEHSTGSVEITWAQSGAAALFEGGRISLQLKKKLKRIETWMDESEQ